MLMGWAAEALNWERICCWTSGALREASAPALLLPSSTSTLTLKEGTSPKTARPDQMRNRVTQMAYTR